MNIEKQKDYEEIPIHDDGIAPIIAGLTEKQSKVVLCDFDTLIYFTLHSGKDEYGNKNPDFTEDDLEYLKSKLSEMIMKVVNNIEKYFDIEALYIFIRGNNNFRKQIFPEYKANRPPKPPLVNNLYDYIKETYQAICADSCEAEDMIFSFCKKLNNDCIIAYCDHDLEEIQDAILYNYQKDFWKRLTPKQALHNKYYKLICGEPGDGANFTPKIGKAYFNKNFTLGMSEEEYEEKSKIAFLKCWKTEEKSEEMFNLAKQIIFLKQIEI